MLAALAGAARADSLLRRNVTTRDSLVAQRADFGHGDIITVLVRERLNSSVQAETNTRRESDVEAQAREGANTFLVTERPTGLGLAPESLPNWQIEAENQTRARGQTRRTSTLETTVPCTVVAVLENGNVVIEGSRTVSINREDNTLLVSGVIRPRDISPENTISSDRLANAQIRLKGRGPLWNNQRRGLITRMLDWISPF